MMPVPDPEPQDSVDYKVKYKTLKRKLKYLIYEQECFFEELRKAQRKLLKVTRDRSFLLDRLMQHDKVEDSHSDSDATASSESENEAQKGGNHSKKKKISGPPQLMTNLGDKSAMSLLSGFARAPSQPSTAQTSNTMKRPDIPRKKSKPSKKAGPVIKTGTGASKSPQITIIKKSSTKAAGQMTREEIERHLETQQKHRQHFMSIERAPCDLPMDIFSNDNSNQDGDIQERHAHLALQDQDSDLVIDLHG